MILNMQHTSWFMFLLAVLAAAVCFLQRVHVEKWTAKDSPNPKNVAQSLGCCCGRAVVLVWM